MPLAHKAQARRRSREIAAVLFKPAHLRRTLAIALVVGSWLTLVNQGDVLLQTGWTAVLCAKVALNILTPFVVANLGLLSRTGSGTTDGGRDADVDKQT